MFYKEGYLNKEIIDEFIDKYSLEFTLALINKLKEDSNFSFATIMGLDDKDKEVVLEHCVVEEGRTSQPCIITIDGVSGFSKWVQNSYIEKHKDKNIKAVFFKKQKQNEYIEKNNIEINEEKLNEAKELVNDFYNIVSKKNIHDKNGEQYELKIIENSDPTINNGELIIDSVNLYKNNVKIGYLKAKYTTKSIIDDVFPTTLLRLLDQANSYLSINKNSTKEDVFLELQKIGYIEEDIENNEENIYKEIKQVEIKLQKKYGREIISNEEYWSNKATTDYSRIEEEYKGKGLAQLMYFYISQHLNSKNVKFRSSTLQSEDAIHLWNGLQKNFPKNIRKGTILNFDKEKTIFYLDIPPNDVCDFKNGRLVHKSPEPIANYLTSKCCNTRKKNQILKL